MLCGMLDLPAPASRNVYAVHAKVISEHCILQAEASLKQAREEVREHYGVSPDEVADILVSCDGTWQKRGFSSLFGAVFVIVYEMGKIVDYTVKPKFCKGCKYWRRKIRPQMPTSSGRTSMSVMLTSLVVLVPWNQREHWKCLNGPWTIKFASRI